MNTEQKQSTQCVLDYSLLRKSPGKRQQIKDRLQQGILGCLAVFIGLTYSSTAIAGRPLEWVRQLGTSSNFDNATDVAVDSSGNVYITGHTDGLLQGNNAGYYDGFVAKYSNSGARIWIREVATDTNDYINGVVVDTSGNVYIAGRTKTNNPSPYAGDDAFVAKYDNNGKRLWIKKLGSSPTSSSADDEATDIAIDSSGNLYLTGLTFGSFGGGSAGSFDAWIAKLNSSGQRLWVRQLGTSGFDESHGVAVDSVGNVYITGETPGSLGGPAAGSDDAWVAKYNSSGQRLWIRQLGTSSLDYSTGVAVDSTSNVYITGGTGGALGGTGVGQAYIAKYNSSGNRVWTTQFGASLPISSDDIKVDSSNNIYIAGSTQNTFGEPSYGTWDAFFSKFNGSGTMLATTTLGTSSIDSANGIVLNTVGNVFITGTTFGSLGGSSAGGTDVFVAKYLP